MAFRIKYHVLFEVHIFHGFYLQDEVDFYGKSKVDKATELLLNNYNILNDLEILPTAKCQRLLNGHRLKFKQSALGFLVGIETATSAAGEIVPKISIAEGTIFSFKIRLKNSDWTNISNVKLRPSVPSNFFFSNFEQLADLQINAAVAPRTLSLPHLAFNEKRPYEMGEIVRDGIGLKRAIKNADGTNAPVDINFWEVVDNLNNVNSTDQKLLPSRFSYQLQPNQGVVIDDLTFDLKRADDSLEKSIAFPILNGKKVVNLDFRRLENERMENLPAGEYTLEVADAAGDFLENIKLHIDDELYDRRDWGSIQIAHQAGLGAHRILENDGSLRKEGTEVLHPVFEIRIKNRATYWKYIFHSSNVFTAGSDADFEAFPDDVSPYCVITKKAFPLSKFLSKDLKNLDGNQLPNPSDLMVKTMADDDRFFSEIYLPKMKVT